LMRLLVEHIPNCQFVRVPEAGHAAFWEQPEIWNRLVLEFEGTHRWIEIEQSSRPQGAHGPGQQPQHPMTFARLETIRVPVLVLVGEADLLSPPALMRLLVAHIPNCQFVRVPEAGHAAFWEQPEIWNRHVLEFVGQH